jgi:pyruvate ferredoxin oxidoreductase beta subunit
LGRLAVETGVFPMYEVENGSYRLNMDPPKLRPVVDYLKTQGRFRHLTDDLREEIQKRVKQDYAQLKKKAKRR